MKESEAKSFLSRGLHKGGEEYHEDKSYQKYIYGENKNYKQIERKIYLSNRELQYKINENQCTLFQSLLKPQQVWTTSSSNSLEVNKAIIQARMVSGHYLTDQHAALDQYQDWCLHTPGLF